MGAALSSPCAIKLDRVDEPSPVSSYPGGGSTSSVISQKPKERERSSSSSSSKTEQRVLKDNSASDAAQSRKQNDDKSPSRKNSDSSATTPQKRPPPIMVAQQSETLSTTEVDGASKFSMESTNNSSNDTKSSTTLPSSVYNVQLYQSPSSRSTKSEQVPFSEANSISSNQLSPIVLQPSNPLPIPSQTLPVRSPKNFENRSNSSEEPPTLQPIRRSFQSPTNRSYEKPTFNSPSTPVNVQSPPSTRTPASTRNRPHYLSKISSPPTRVNSPNSMLSSLRQSRDQKSNSDSSVYDVSTSCSLSESLELNTTLNSKKSLSSSSVSENHPHTLKQKSSSSASLATSVNNNVKTMKDQIEESVMKFNASIGTDSKRILPKRRHSLLASGRNSPSLLNELKQNEKSDSTCSPSTVYNPSIVEIGKSNLERIQQERRFSDFVTPLAKKRCPCNQATKPSNSNRNSRNKLRASVENPAATLNPVRAPARRRMSISVSPQHKVEMTTTAQVGRDQHGRKIINQYTIIKKLGKGSYGSVKLGKNEQTGQLAAIKVINRSLLNNIKKKWSAPGQQQNNQISKIKLEIAILKNLDHPNIVRLLEVIDDPMNDKICLVFEFIDGGELMKLNDDGVLVDGNPFTEDEARYYFRQMLNSLEYLHFNRVVHRDIKPSNILLTKTRDVKLSDFGVSKLLGEDEEDTLDDSQGTPAFLPPEACSKGKIQGKPADIWALGITLYCMVVGKVPFRSDEAGASKLLYLYYYIQHEEPQIPETLSPELRDIITRMLDKNAKSRITMDELQEHPWVSKDEEETFIEEPQKTLSELYPDFSSPNIQYLETRRKSAIPTNRTFVHHAQLRKMHSRRKVVVDDEDIDNAIKEKEYDPNTPKKTSFKKEHHHHNASTDKISLVRNRSSCKILIQEPQDVPIPTIEISSKTE